MTDLAYLCNLTVNTWHQARMRFRAHHQKDAHQAQKPTLILLRKANTASLKSQPDKVGLS